MSEVSPFAIGDLRDGDNHELCLDTEAPALRVASPVWPAQASTAVNLDKDLTQPDESGDDYIYWSN